MNADIATLNDTQGETLAGMPNSFDLENCVHCFNHTLQLSAKTLLCPFNVGLGKMTEDGHNNDVDDLLDEELDNSDDNNNDSLLGVLGVDDIDDGINKMNELDADEWEVMLADTAAVHQW